jgi:hypothetical protein
MDSIRVSEAPDTGSIPVEATKAALSKFLEMCGFYNFVQSFRGSVQEEVPRGKTQTRQLSNGESEVAYSKNLNQLPTTIQYS